MNVVCADVMYLLAAGWADVYAAKPTSQPTSFQYKDQISMITIMVIVTVTT